jgi:hypothetical protein
MRRVRSCLGCAHVPPQATQAYLAGNKALAKELGAQGRAANQAMKQAHAEASDRIYSARNGQAGPRMQSPPQLEPQCSRLKRFRHATKGMLAGPAPGMKGW